MSIVKLDVDVIIVNAVFVPTKYSCGGARKLKVNKLYSVLPS